MFVSSNPSLISKIDTKRKLSCNQRIHDFRVYVSYYSARLFSYLLLIFNRTNDVIYLINKFPCFHLNSLNREKISIVAT